jgi:hypothetical protein
MFEKFGQAAEATATAVSRRLFLGRLGAICSGAVLGSLVLGSAARAFASDARAQKAGSASRGGDPKGCTNGLTWCGKRCGCMGFPCPRGCR